MRPAGSSGRVAVSLSGALVLVLALLGGAPAPAQQGGARGVVIEAETFTPDAAPSEEATAAPASAARPPAEGVPRAAAGASGNDAAAARSGPGVELITGGRSTDGAAHVGRLPVLD